MSLARLDSDVLVLNRLFQAIHVTSVRRAVTLLYVGHARAVLEDYSTYTWEEWCDIPPQAAQESVSTASFQLAIPRVLQLSTFERVPRREIKFTRKNIFARDSNQCQYCGRRPALKDLNLDHVIPVSRGGKTTWENIVCCCLRCNGHKGNRLPREIDMRLLHKPKKPRWHPFFRLLTSNVAHAQWKNFLDVAYWNVELKSE